MPFWLRGARTLIMRQFEPQAYLKAIRDHEVTAINLVPTMLQMLLGQPGFDDIAFRAASALIFEGTTQPSGYTEPLLHSYRLKKKAAA